ncbi:translation elongation factor Ts [Sphingomonas sanguinis]|jgi:elongation factor Ts|uniref:Elongation factor Ts n=1 Tax=Sphingomonas sanguinis TaxID=33051 RepID=A0A7Y7QWZ3_9SPHN|nr:translation elongation factor Ts [Sphingomonas sanguinis]MBZ6382280.1 translation elongation factor Ts [Sphingomonas sanguinis]NNG50866.1 elongation factor Ts [Sphingomonas sanguinis]NNG54346.1 elongation factor Ts [Sphingomonas sanguinis]NVP31578.1 elongation factor Ts [Sphingomonas sanguinis]HJO66803.1 translation elongation factor Ts [Sphingomonas sanguinis]
MADITAAMVKDLREKSGAGMMDCKKALNEAAGDMDAALDWLRTKGLAAAQKKSSRTAAEGLVGVATSGTVGAAVEVNSETDFVAKNDQFQAFVKDVTEIALKTSDDVEALKNEAMPQGGTVAEVLTNNVATIGENQSLRRAKRLEVSKGAVVSYVHNQQAPGLGKIGVLVALESDASDEVLQKLGKDLAMHVAAAFPKALNEEDLDEAEIERERAIATEKAAESGKPADIIAKMVEGGIAKYRKEHALVSQLFVMDGKTKISDVVAKAAKDAGAEIKLVDYVRFQLGEGIEKEASDFAAEVAAASGVPQKA